MFTFAHTNTVLKNYIKFTASLLGYIKLVILLYDSHLYFDLQKVKTK